MIISLRNW